MPRTASPPIISLKLCSFDRDEPGWAVAFLLGVFPRLLLVIEFVALALIGRQFAYVTTYRLYLDRAIGDAQHSMITQQFELHGRQVTPRIVTRGSERLLFHAPSPSAFTLHVELQTPQ